MNRAFLYKTLSLVPISMVVFHTLLVVSIGICIYSGRKESSEAVGAWVVFMLFDFPLGWLAVPAEIWIIPIIRQKCSSVVLDVYIPATTFTFLGGIQYYLVAKIIVYWYLKRLKKNIQPE